MRVLFLTYHLPYPPFSGGRRREYEFLTRLGQKFEIHLCCVSKTYALDREYIEQIRPYCAEVHLFEALMPGSLSTHYTMTAAQPVSPPFQVLRHTSLECAFFLSQAFQEKRFDIAHVEGYYMIQYFPTTTSIPILLMEQNIEYMLCLQQLLVSKTQDDKRSYASNYARTLIWEQYAWQRATLCTVITKEDQRLIAQKKADSNIVCIPNGVDHSAILEHTSIANTTCFLCEKTREFALLFVGNFAYGPNVDAIHYFVEGIFPQILREIPEVKFYIVGNAPTPSISALGEHSQMIVTGLVRSLDIYFARADIFVCPLRVGGGIKVKILEALKAGKAIVSTSIGAQGIENPRQLMRVADDPTNFARQVIYLRQHPNERKRLEKVASTFAQHLPTWDETAAVLSRCYEQVGTSALNKA